MAPTGRQSRHRARAPAPFVRLCRTASRCGMPVERRYTRSVRAPPDPSAHDGGREPCRPRRQADAAVALAMARALESPQNDQSGEVPTANSCLRLHDTKEGASVRPIGLPAVDMLEADRPREAVGPVFRGFLDGKPLIG